MINEKFKILKKYVNNNFPGDRISIKDNKIIYSDAHFMLIYPLEDSKIGEGTYLIDKKLEIKEKIEKYPNFEAVRLRFKEKPDILKISNLSVYYDTRLYLLEYVIYGLACYQNFYINKKYFPLLDWFLTTNYEKDIEVRVKIDKYDKSIYSCVLFYSLEDQEKQKELYLMSLALEIERLLHLG